MIKYIVGYYISMRGRRSAIMLNEKSPKIRINANDKKDSVQISIKKISKRPVPSSV